MSELDLKVLNILTNNKSDLREFVLSSSENVFDKEYRRFIKHMTRYYHSFNSCPSLDALLETAGQNANLEEYVVDVWKEVEEQEVDKRDFKLLLSKLQKRYNARLISDLLSDLDQGGADEEEVDIDEQNTKLIKTYNEIRALGEQKAYKVVSLRESAEDWAMQFRARQTNPELSKGTFTGFSVLDHYTYGIRPAELWLIAGDTAGGKSLLLINLAKNMWMGENELPINGKQLKEVIDNNSWKPGNDVLFVTLEMPESEIQDRIQSAMCDIDSLNLMKGKITKEEGKRLAIALKFRQECPYDMAIADVPRGCSMAQIQHVYDEECLRLGKKIKVVLIDYLGLMADSGEDSDADWEKLKNIAEQMHEFARVNDVAVITAVQVKTSKP
ncbi:MAG TPA: DnaB-like helicase C-terminal domain-containing protein, partial [Candidatus Glassbacteria bacterium]|nr:DnaB-like helicase C-terminal domain-containing protein [Candidatus Glassbacteria bacterium]